MDSLLSFPVGLFHPLQHAGLSQRSPGGRQTNHNTPQTVGAFTSVLCAAPVRQFISSGKN
jgi:hypothetical protein